MRHRLCCAAVAACLIAASGCSADRDGEPTAAAPSTSPSPTASPSTSQTASGPTADRRLLVTWTTRLGRQVQALYEQTGDYPRDPDAPALRTVVGRLPDGLTLTSYGYAEVGPAVTLCVSSLRPAMTAQWTTTSSTVRTFTGASAEQQCVVPGS